MDEIAYYKKGIYKIASSFDAKRKKQYWQILKRMNGGTENTVDTLKKTRMFDLYHSTKTKNANKILEEGFKNVGGGMGGIYGKGIYFGGENFGPNGAYKDIFSTLRLKRPSEIPSTSKDLYPKTTKIMAHTTGLNPRKMSDVARASQTYGQKGAVSKVTKEVANNIGDMFDIDTKYIDDIMPIMSSDKYLKSHTKNYAPMGSQILIKGNAGDVSVKPSLIKLESRPTVESIRKYNQPNLDMLNKSENVLGKSGVDAFRKKLNNIIKEELEGI